MAYTEFYVRSGGSNLNAGSTDTDAATLTFTSGNWNQTTRVFTAAGANLSGISVGMWASVYADGAAAPTGYVARITAVDDGADTITLDSTAKAGTAPTTGTGTRTIKVGGAWGGSGTGDVSHAITFSANTLVDSSGNQPRVNFNNASSWVVSTGITRSATGCVTLQGYTTTAGDGGRFTLTTATDAVTPLTISGAGIALIDAIVSSTATGGTAVGLTVSGQAVLLMRVTSHGHRGAGFNNSSAAGDYIECEAYDCNKSNTADRAGFYSNGNGPRYIRCVSHNNSGSSSSGFYLSVASVLINCISESNGQHGVAWALTSGNQQGTMLGCDLYNNGSAGLFCDNFSGSFTPSVQNCNFVKNGTWGIDVSEPTLSKLLVINCGFGGGADANTSGDITGEREEIGTVNYTTNPWADPANGDFTITDAAAKNAGRGNFTMDSGSYSSSTTSYPNIGAAQHDGGGAVYHGAMSGGLLT